MEKPALLHKSENDHKKPEKIFFPAPAVTPRKLYSQTSIRAKIIKKKVLYFNFPDSLIHSTLLEMSEVSSETDMLLISEPWQTDAAISR